MGDSIFIQPIKRWLSSKRGRKGSDSSTSVTSLTPEEQFAQLMGSSSNTAGQIVAGSDSPVLTQAAPSIPEQQSMSCGSCGQSISQEARFCPYCSNQILQNSAPTAAPDIPEQDHMSCGRCGQSISQEARFCPYCSNQIDQVVAPTSAPIEQRSAQPIQPASSEEESKPVIQRISLGATDEGSLNDEQPIRLVESALQDEQPIQVVERVAPTLPQLSDDDADESTNVGMAGSLRGIFTNKSAINPDTVAFLERHGTVGTQELLDELISMHRALR